MKTTKEFLIGMFDSELPAFVKVIEALPADKLDWKPDPKSASALERAAQMAREANELTGILKNGILNYDPTVKPTWTTTAEMSAAFSKGFADAKVALAAMTDADWEADSAMMMGGKEVWKSKRGDMALGFMLDLIHHRGQLSTYIRPMGGKVPSIYGPSADSAE
jgi:uncharacterized damage-inducible protein DinB